MGRVKLRYTSDYKLNLIEPFAIEEEEEIDMCKAIQGMREEERIEGRIEGRTEGKGSIILTFMEKSKCDLEAALEFFNIEHEEREGIIRFVEANR